MNATNHETPSTITAADDSPGRHPGDVFAAIASLINSAESARARVDAIAELLAEEFDAAASLVSIAAGSEDLTAASIHGSEDAKQAWTRTLQPVSLDAHANGVRIARLYAGNGAAPSLAVLAAPIAGPNGDSVGGVALACPCETAERADRLLNTLHAACAQAGAVIHAKTLPSRNAAPIDDFARVYAKAGSYTSMRHFAFAVANAFRNKLGCEQASMGIVRNDGSIRVLCVSGLDEVKRRTPGAHRIEQAMGECADAERTLLAQPGERWDENTSGGRNFLHEKWRADTGDACVASFPIMSDDGALGVISVRRAGSNPFRQGEIEAAEKLVAPLAGALPLVQRATTSTPKRVAGDVKRSIRWTFSPASLVGKCVAATLIAAIVFFALSTREHRVTMPATVIADSAHTIAVPIPGRIDQVLVKAGDTVRPGQLIARMDTSDLQAEIAGLDAEISRLTVTRQASAGQRDPAAASIAAAEAAALRARRDLLSSRVEAASIVAPSAGVVVGDRPELMAGRVVPIGHAICSIVDPDELSIELRSADGASLALPVGSRVTFITHARPETPGETTLDSVTNVASQKESGSAFLASAALPGDQDWLRPGMTGVARVDAGRKANWWLATHKIADAARLNFWFHQ